MWRCVVCCCEMLCSVLLCCTVVYVLCGLVFLIRAMCIAVLGVVLRRVVLRILVFCRFAVHDFV